MMELLEGVDKIKESEKIMSAKDFKETGEKVLTQCKILIIVHFSRK